MCPVRSSGFIAITIPGSGRGKYARRSTRAPIRLLVDQDRANLAVAKAQLEKDKSNLAYTKTNSERLSNLAATNAVSKDAADIARE